MRKVATQMFLWESLFFATSVAIASAQSIASGQNVYRFPNAQVLATQKTSAGFGHSLRVVANDGPQQAIKYVFLESNALQGNVEQDSIDLPHLPLGDWNEAHIYMDRHTGTYRISNTTLTSRLEMMSDWHPRNIDYLEFVNVETLQQDRLQVVTHPDFIAPVLIKVASFPWEMPSLEQEATIYRLLGGSGATPEFLGHVSERGQVIGFITEYVKEVPSIRKTNMQGCLATLHILHERGIAHGDAHDGNCLIRKDGTSVLIDFELSLETWSHEEFERDLDIMGRCIHEFSEHS